MKMKPKWVQPTLIKRKWYQAQIKTKIYRNDKQMWEEKLLLFGFIKFYRYMQMKEDGYMYYYYRLIKHR